MTSVNSLPSFACVFLHVLVFVESRPAQHAPRGRPLTPVKAVTVMCHPDAMEVVVNAQLFGPGLPVAMRDVGLGAACGRNKNTNSKSCCKATRSKPDQYTIHTQLTHCGTRMTLTRDSLEYTNVLIYAPEPPQNPGDVIRLDGVVIPVKCKYLRRYSVNSSSVLPTWTPFGSSGTASSALDFELKLMSDDWRYERSSNVYWFGQTIHIEASISMANKTWLNVFVDHCVATTTSSLDEDLKYTFIENNGCLMDSWYSPPKSIFLPRIEGNKLRILIKAFRFLQQRGNLIYINCYLKAVPAVQRTSSQNRACTFIEDRWISADGDHQVCSSCDVTQAPPIDPLSPTHFPQLTHGQQSTASKSDSEWGKTTMLGPLVVIQEDAIESTSSMTPLPTKSVDVKLTIDQPEVHVVSTTANQVMEQLEFQTTQQVSNFGVTTTDAFPIFTDVPQPEDRVLDLGITMTENITILHPTTWIPQSSTQTSNEPTHTQIYTDQPELSDLNTTEMDGLQDQTIWQLSNRTLPTETAFPSTTDLTQEQEWETSLFEHLLVERQENMTGSVGVLHTSTPEPVDVKPNADQPELLVNTTLSPVLEQLELQAIQQISNFTSTKAEDFPANVDLRLLENNSLNEEWRESPILDPLYTILNQNDSVGSTSIPATLTDLVNINADSAGLVFSTTVSPESTSEWSVLDLHQVSDNGLTGDFQKDSTAEEDSLNMATFTQN